MTLGNKRDAALASIGGGEYLGEGCSRVARRINGVVYKVHCDEEYPNANLLEAENMAMFNANNSNPLFRVPAFRLIDIGEDAPVMAMRYINGEPLTECLCKYNIKPYTSHDIGCLPLDAEKYLTSVVGLSDLSYGNVLRDESGIMWVVDFGE